MKNKIKKILFIIPCLDLGGIETYITNLSLELNKSKVLIPSILLLSNKYDSNLMNKIKDKIEVYFISEFMKGMDFLKDIHYLLNVSMPLDTLKVYNCFNSYSYIHSVDSFSNEIAIRFNKTIPNIRLTTGVYHSKEYLWNIKGAYFRKIQRLIFSNYPKKNIYFGNTEIKKLYTNFFNEKFNESISFPLGIDIEKYKTIIPDYKNKVIVMIGRYVKFKAYQKGLIKVFADLNLSKYKYELHYYGYGENEYFLKNYALKHNVNVKFKGKLDYENLGKVFEKAFLFVGGGSTIIEASAAGVPSIIGIESNEYNTYGFFSDLVGYSYNRNDLNIHKMSLDKAINDFWLNLSSESFKQLSLKHKIKADEFSIKKNANLFFEFVIKAEVSNDFKYNSIKYKLSNIYWALLGVLKLNSSFKKRYD